jgi:hypothetical protein
MKLLPHEKALLHAGALVDVTHRRASSTWLRADSSAVESGFVSVFRPMGDLELLFLLQHSQLPTTQPYQAIIEGASGRIYAEKYLNGKKWVDSCPTTVVEFIVPKVTVDTLMAVQHKAEDGAISMGLGSKAGKGLGLFNAALQQPGSSWKIVTVKRRIKDSKRLPGQHKGQPKG